MVILVGGRCPEGNVLGLAFGRRDLYRRCRRWRRRRRLWLWRVIRAGAAACRVAVLSRRALFTRDLATNDSREHTMHTHLDDWTHLLAPRASSYVHCTRHRQFISYRRPFIPMRALYRATLRYSVVSGPILRNFSGCTISKVHVWCNTLTLSKVTTS